MTSVLRKFSFLKEGLLPKLLLFSTMLVIATLITFSLFLSTIFKEIMEEQIGERALAISKTISMMPEVIELVEAKDPQGKLQESILHIQRNIDAQFIVIGDTNSMRLTHPIEERIEEKMVGEDNDKALQFGLYYISKSVGSLGPSIRGKSPIFNLNGEIIGIVSVGYLEKRVRQITEQYHTQFLGYLYIALAMTIVMAFLLSRKIKSSLLGYEPKEISRLFLEKEAILNSVKEAIIATNKEGVISVCNEVAKTYFGIDAQSKTPPAALHKFLITCKEMKDASIEIEGGGLYLQSLAHYPRQHYHWDGGKLP